MGTVAVIEVAVTLVVASVVCVPLALQLTSAPPVGSVDGIKLEPVRFSGNDAAPGEAEAGAMEFKTGNGLGIGLMMKVRVLERPLLVLPEWGFIVLMEAVPGLATSEAGTTAVTLVTLLLASNVTVVTRFPPFHCTLVPATNPPPNMVKVMGLAPPALTMDGEIEIRLAPVLPWKVLP